MARAWSHQKRENIGHGQPGPVPPGLDYVLWQGPARSAVLRESASLQVALVLALGDR